MRAQTILFTIFSAFILMLSGCVTEENGDSDQRSPAAGLPLLDEGQFPGMIIGFNPSNPPATTDSIEARWQEALDAGMSVGRLQIDWDELEPQRGEYDKDALENRLEEYRSLGLQTFLLISVYDSDGPVVPDYLEGRSLNDPELILRFNRLMDWVIPMLTAYDGYMISVLNEADNSFGGIPGLHDQVLEFLQEVKRHIRTIDDRMAVTATIAEGNVGIGKPGVQALIDESDVACFNFYGATALAEFPYYEPQGEAEIRADIARMLDISGSKQIVIQELGMWSGSTLLPSNAEIQRRFFEIFFEEMERQDRIRAAYVFQLVDWSPEVTQIFVDILRDENVPEEFIDVFVESLETIGLIRYEDGMRRPAWDEFIRWTDRFSGR
jgi:hypothetical protein